MLKQKIKTCSEFSFAKRIRGLAPKLAELEPFLCEWWKILDFGCIGRFQQIYVSCRIFIFRRHGHIFWPKLVLFFSLTHKLLIFYVYEVASILIHSGLRQKRISWGGGGLLKLEFHSRFDKKYFARNRFRFVIFSLF